MQVRSNKLVITTVLLRASALLLILTFLSVAIFSPRHIGVAGAETEKNGSPGDEKAALIDSALYTRAAFFGAQALVPYPTAEARDRLAALQAKYPNDPQIDLKLSEFDEKLGRAKLTPARRCAPLSNMSRKS